MATSNKKRSSPKKTYWFTKVRWSYLPVSWQGWLCYVPYIIWLMVSFELVDVRSHSVSDTLIGIVPYWVSGAVVMQWLASHKSK